MKVRLVPCGLWVRLVSLVLVAVTLLQWPDAAVGVEAATGQVNQTVAYTSA